MKFSCTKNNLQKALAITSHITTKNINLPILNNVLIHADAAKLRLTTTNLEIAVSCNLRGKIDEEGEFTVPSKLIFDYVNLLPNEKIDIEQEEETLTVRCGSDETRIHGLPSNDFPLVPSVSAEQSIDIPVEPFRQAIARVLFAATTNESRPELTGIFLQFFPSNGSEQGKIVLAATDSYRLAECIISLPSLQGEKPFSVIVPARTMMEISRIFSVLKDDPETPTTVTVRLSDNQIVFLFGIVELISRTIEGHYPDYQQIIPTQFRTTALVDKSDLSTAVKAASLFSRQNLYDISIAISPESGSIILKAMDAGRGENTTTCQAECTGEENGMTLNFRYLLDGLNALSGEKAFFLFIDAMNPCIIRSSSSDLSYTYVIMPLRQ